MPPTGLNRSRLEPKFSLSLYRDRRGGRTLTPPRADAHPRVSLSLSLSPVPLALSRKLWVEVLQSSHGARSLKPRSALNCSNGSIATSDVEIGSSIWTQKLLATGHRRGRASAMLGLNGGVTSETGSRQIGQSGHLRLRLQLFAVVWHSTRVPKKRDAASPGGGN